MTAGGDPYREISSNALPEVTIVRLYASTEQKIETEHEFGDGLTQAPIDMVVDTISNPTDVYASTGYPEGNYIFTSVNNTYGGNRCIVPVKVIEGTSARVKTALFTECPAGNLIWSKSDGNG